MLSRHSYAVAVALYARGSIEAAWVGRPGGRGLSAVLSSRRGREDEEQIRYTNTYNIHDTASSQSPPPSRSASHAVAIALPHLVAAAPARPERATRNALPAIGLTFHLAIISRDGSSPIATTLWEACLL